MVFCDDGSRWRVWELVRMAFLLLKFLLIYSFGINAKLHLYFRHSYLQFYYAMYLCATHLLLNSYWSFDEESYWFFISMLLFYFHTYCYAFFRKQSTYNQVSRHWFCEDFFPHVFPASWVCAFGGHSLERYRLTIRGTFLINADYCKCDQECFLHIAQGWKSWLQHAYHP